ATEFRSRSSTMPDSESSRTHGPSRTHGMRQIRAEGSRLHRQVLLPSERFLHNESVGGALLLVCAIVALAWANSPWSEWYFALGATPVGLQIGTFALTLDLQHWINDGLMAVFFFVVALEIKRELIFGDLSE